MSFATLVSNAFLVPNKMRVAKKNVNNASRNTATVAGTGKGFVGHHYHKESAPMDVNYSKHVPGYDAMSRPQKYRARKSVKHTVVKMQEDQGQKNAVRNTSDVARKAFSAFQDCVELCEGPECVQECRVEFDQM